MNEPAVIYVRKQNSVDEEVICKMTLEYNKDILVKIYYGKDGFEELQENAIEGKFKLIYCLRADRLGSCSLDAIKILSNFDRGVTELSNKEIVKLKFPIYFYFVENDNLLVKNSDEHFRFVTLVGVCELNSDCLEKFGKVYKFDRW